MSDRRSEYDPRQQYGEGVPGCSAEGDAQGAIKDGGRCVKHRCFVDWGGSSVLMEDGKGEGRKHTHLSEIFEVHMVSCGSDTDKNEGGIAEIDDLVVFIAAIVLDPTYAEGDLANVSDENNFERELTVAKIGNGTHELGNVGSQVVIL
jgi:hypothetical protein